MDHDYFGEDVAARYDDTSQEPFEAATITAAVDLLAELAGQRDVASRRDVAGRRDLAGAAPSPGGRALELGIGTGRIALPLAARGVEVHGIDLSQAMVDRLRAKPGGGSIPVTIGSFATTTVDSTFSLAYLVFNTIMNLTSQSAQVACFRAVAQHLEPGGCFVIEVMVPELQYLPPGRTVVPFEVSATRWGFDTYDIANQGVTSHHLEIVDGQAVTSSIPFRYVWPAELDLMAQLAGLRLRDRWANWRRAPFTSDSLSHISVWERPPE